MPELSFVYLCQAEISITSPTCHRLASMPLPTLAVDPPGHALAVFPYPSRSHLYAVAR
jgi:hypothetical protein